MKLYHYTAEHLARAIAREGITKGAVLRRIDPLAIAWGYIWLTTSDRWDQPWDTQLSIPYSRAAVRFTVSLPRAASRHLMTWPETKRVLRVDEETAAILEMCPGQETWRIYHGKVKPEWLTARESRPSLVGGAA